jgi:hypothetical protein
MSSSFLQPSQGSQSLSSLLKHSIEPFASVATLFAVAYFNDEVIDYRYSTLAFLRWCIVHLLPKPPSRA